MSAKGSLLFAKYAFSPNQLKYCGPNDNRAIFNYCVASQSDAGLVNLLKKFEGAYPYLQLIAKSNNIKDPFDEKVVEAYWIGNSLLKRINTHDFYEQLKNRFSKKIDPKVMKWILSKPPEGAKPHHSFHVLDIYTKTGKIRGDLKSNVISTINNCLILWGQATNIRDNKLIVKYHPLIIRNNTLIFDQESKKEIQWLFQQPKIGDWISFHWNNMCEILDQNKLANLKAWTNYHLKIANRTI